MNTLKAVTVIDDAWMHKKWWIITWWFCFLPLHRVLSYPQSRYPIFFFNKTHALLLHGIIYVTEAKPKYWSTVWNAKYNSQFNNALLLPMTFWWSFHLIYLNYALNLCERHMVVLGFYSLFLYFSVFLNKQWRSSYSQAAFTYLLCTRCFFKLYSHR